MSFKNIVLFLVCILSTQVYSQNKVRWLTWEEAMKKQEKTPRKLLIDVVTDRCGFCKKMDATTFSEDKIAKYINENFYAVKFNAGDKVEINFKGQTYSYINTFTGGYHELAADILNGNLLFPSIVFFDEVLEKLQTIPGYQDPETFKMIVNFFGEDFHKDTPYRKFVRTYTSCEKTTFPVTKKN
jgi:thioredoxin-related protein